MDDPRTLYNCVGIETFFYTESDIVVKTLTWVCIPNLPLEVFEEEVLLEMGNLLEKAIKVDTTTMKVERGRYARVCVQMDLQRQLSRGSS